MSPVVRLLFALACAALLHCGICTDQNCYTIQIGDEYIGDFPKFEFTKNVTGHRKTLVDIENPCNHLQDVDAKLVYERVTVCNNDNFILKINEPGHGEFSPIDVRCFFKMFDVKVPCFLLEFDMEVTIYQVCIPKDFQNLPYKGSSRALQGKLHYRNRFYSERY